MAGDVLDFEARRQQQVAREESETAEFIRACQSDCADQLRDLAERVEKGEIFSVVLVGVGDDSEGFSEFTALAGDFCTHESMLLGLLEKTKQRLCVIVSELEDDADEAS